MKGGKAIIEEWYCRRAAAREKYLETMEMALSRVVDPYYS